MPQDPPGIVSLADVKAQLRIAPDDTDDDQVLLAYIAGIGTVIEDYKHEVILPREVRQDVDARHTRRFRLYSVPVLSLTSVAAVDGSRTWDVSAMRVASSGVVRVLTGPALSGLVEVVFQAGYASVPANYRQGALVALQHLYETRRGVGTVPTGLNGGEEHYDPRFSYSIPRKALEWLGAPNPLVA